MQASIEDSQSSSSVAISKTGIPLDPQNGLAFGFVEADLVDQVAESNQWKERTAAIERIEDMFMKLLQESQRPALSENNATNLLAFVYKFIPDINFKISLSSIKIVTLILQFDIANVKKHFQAVFGVLIEKFSDSKQVVRDAVLECCTYLLKHTKPFIFANQVCKNLQHSNQYVREGSLTLIVRCVLEQTKSDKGQKISSLKPQIPGSSEQGSLSLLTNVQILEEICFLVKVEDKKHLQQNGIDALALFITKSPQKMKTEQIILKELVQGDISKAA